MLGLSVGANILVFSIVNAVYFRPPPYRDVDRLVLVRQATNIRGCSGGCDVPIDVPDLPRWADRLSPVADVAAGATYWGVLSTRLETTYAVGAAVTPNFFSILGISAWRGRVLTGDDDRQSAQGTMVLGYAFWREAFAGDSGVLGSSVRLDNRDYRIVGILAPENGIGRPVLDVDDPGVMPTVPFFIPVGSSELGAPQRPASHVRLVARLKPSAERAQLVARVASLLASQEQSPRPVPIVAGLRHELAKEYGGSYPIFLGAVMLFLGVACVNLASLFLARLSSRRRDIAVCAALGATRTTLLRPFLFESMTVAAIGGLIGLAISILGVHLAVTYLPGIGVPYWTRFTIDGRVLLFALVVTNAAGLLVGVAPALVVTQRPVHLAIREGGSVVSTAPHIAAARRYLVSLEIAVTLVLLASAGLLGKTFLAAARRDTGMEKTHLATVVVDARALADSAPARRLAIVQSLVERLTKVPGVRSAGARGEANEPSQPGLTRDVDTAMIPAGSAPASASVVSPGYFRTVGTRLIRGREFTAGDGLGAPAVAMLSDSTARRLFPDQDAVGRRVKFGPPSSPLPWLTIVGVVEDAGQMLSAKAPSYRAVLYRASTQVPMTHIRLMVRTSGPSSAVLAVMRSTIHELAPRSPIAGLTTIDEATDRALAPLRTNTFVLTAFAILAVVIAALGIYGTVAYLVADRTDEIGVRTALGASREDVVLLHMNDAAIMAALGIVGGLVGSYLFTQVLRSIIYETDPTDPTVLASAAALLAVVALVAAFLPARRAAAVDPVRALRGM